MISKGKNKGTIRFVYRPEKRVKKVSLAGNFNGWQPATMRKQKNGSYAATLPIPPGSYQYKFMVDGEWLNDPDNEACVANEHGTINSVLVVE
jgi:1,4-alpha-glucan branching enzyme